MIISFLFKQYEGERIFFKIFLFIRWIFSPYGELEKHIPANCRIVDIGCGHGIFANYLSLVLTRNVLGVDISKKRIRSAKNSIKNRANISFQLCDAAKFNIPRCDLITMVDFLHHLPSGLQEDIIKNSFEALSNNGIILIKEVDMRPKIKYYYNCIVDFLAGVFHITEGSTCHYRSSENFKWLLTKAGFKNARIIHISKIDPAPHVIIKGEKSYETKK